jgi:hypothetical protein
LNPVIISEKPTDSSPTTQTVSSLGALEEVFFQDEEPSIDIPMISDNTTIPVITKNIILFLEREAISIIRNY